MQKNKTNLMNIILQIVRDNNRYFLIFLYYLILDKLLNFVMHMIHLLLISRNQLLFLNLMSNIVLQEYFSASMFASALTAMVSSHESIKNISLIFIILINGEFCHIFEHLSVKILYFRNKAVK